MYKNIQMQRLQLSVLHVFAIQHSSFYSVLKVHCSKICPEHQCIPNAYILYLIGKKIYTVSSISFKNIVMNGNFKEILYISYIALPHKLYSSIHVTTFTPNEIYKHRTEYYMYEKVYRDVYIIQMYLPEDQHYRIHYIMLYMYICIIGILIIENKILKKSHRVYC